jgi:hypothetical protein
MGAWLAFWLIIFWLFAAPFLQHHTAGVND